MAGDTFQKFKDSTSRVIAKISIKTSSSLEKSKIKMPIDSLTKEIKKCLRILAKKYILYGCKMIYQTRNCQKSWKLLNRDRTTYD